MALFWYGVCGLAGLLMIVGHTNKLLTTPNRKALQKLLLGYTSLESTENLQDEQKPYLKIFLKQMLVIMALGLSCAPAYLTLIGAFEDKYLMFKGALILVVSLGTKILLWLNISALIGTR